MTRSSLPKIEIRFVFVRVYVCMCVCVYVWMYVSVYLYMCADICSSNCVRVCIHGHIRILDSAKCSTHRALHFWIWRRPWICFLTFYNCRQRRDLVWLVLYVGWKKKVQGKFNSHKIKNNSPKYHKILSSPSSSFFTIVYALSLWCVYGMSIPICTCGWCAYEGFWIAQNGQLTGLYIFQYDDVPGNLFEHFATVVKFPLNYHKILSSSSSTLFTMTASLERFKVGF